MERLQEQSKLDGEEELGVVEDITNVESLRLELSDSEDG
eukprot:CAMPEP_0117066240 /NCGR_PEP_ID=MMETSP0472-20121206/46322_1 /TAXON_ID=693140 ORGANISM="Tiarina fusus, Strain LIS" /NCGR_SAMPLE_ID=MMETSP0472 /ASSEMBLY_ACC=CAM_ASM_000603 /LENGTH=38 /DNA_ID= /DNA_START= /DNA_END= /DNA_ORIENTATION=